MDPTKLVSTYQTIRDTLLQGCQGYNNSRHVLEYDRQGQTVSLNVKEMLLLGAVSMLDCLVSGKTGAGKTHLANLAMAALFGKESTRKNKQEGDTDRKSGYVNKTITPSMRPEQFLDFDASCLHDGGRCGNDEPQATKSIQDSLKATPILTVPGVVLNEANRAPSMVQNYLIPFLDRSMDIEGVHLKVGHELSQDSGATYQYRIITINEGEEYAVEAMDKALRDRVGLEIPMDCFYQSPQDALDMFQRWREETPLKAAQDSPGCLDQLIELVTSMHSIPVDPEVDRILLYLSGISYCSRLAERQWPPILEALDGHSLDFCDTCHYAARHLDTNRGNLCGASRAPTQRALKALLLASRVLALTAASRTPDGMATPCSVVPEDVWAMAPFVLQHKLQLAEAWKRDLFNDSGGRQSAYSTWIATRQALELIRKRYQRLVDGKILDLLDQPDPEAIEKYLRYCHDTGDFWAIRMIPASHESLAATQLGSPKATP